MMTIFGGVREDFLLYQKQLPAMLSQKKSIMQAPAVSMSMDLFCENCL